MNPKKGEKGATNEKTRKTLSIALKKEIVEKFESGIKQKVIADQYGLHKNTVHTIISRKEEIKHAKVAKGVTKLHSQNRRKSYVDEMEDKVFTWLTERLETGDSMITQESICQKARIVYEDLKRRGKENGEPTEEENEDFKGSRGWCYRFCKRTGIYDLLSGKAGSGRKEASAEILGTTPKTAPLSQPKEQQMVLQTSCEKSQSNNSELKGKQFWKEECGNINEAIRIAFKASDQVKEHSMHSAWKNLIPELVWGKNDPNDNAKETTSSAQETVMEVDVENIKVEPQEPLPLEVILQVSGENQDRNRTISSEDEAACKDSISTSVIIELISKWEDVRRIVHSWHPNQCEASQLGDLFNTKVVDHFRDLLKKREEKRNSSSPVILKTLGLQKTASAKLN